jgi:hypothetical protein
MKVKVDAEGNVYITLTATQAGFLHPGLKLLANYYSNATAEVLANEMSEVVGYE